MFTEGYQYLSDTLKMDIQQIPFPDDSWDMVIANHVLEHVENDALAMSEVWRVLKPNGIAILQVPIATDLKSTIEVPSGTDDLSYEKITGQFDHRRLYGMDYFDRLKQAGFELEFWSNDKMNSSLGLNPLERVVVARKIKT
jgi:ubiquinone/menaquinone biosynthesis C-methylase UbiE